MQGRFLVFGDIHGEYEKFMGAWSAAGANAEADEIIFLGDYVDRGPEPKKVLDFLRGLAGRHNIHFLRGNHEAMLLAAAGGWEEYKSMGLSGEMFGWLINGGASTFEQIGGSREEFFGYVDFLRELPVCYEAEIAGRDYFFAHAGVRPSVPLAEQEEKDLLWLREPYISGYDGETVVVTGHTPTCAIEKGRYTPIVRPAQIFMDTGSFMPAGKVSCLDLVSGKVWQG